MANNNETPFVITQLERARKIAISQASKATKTRDRVKKQEWEEKRDYLTKSIKKFKEFDGEVSDQIFVSYSEDEGTPYFKILKDALNMTSYEVITGFEDAKNNSNHVVRNVLEQLKDSIFYIGILTKQKKIEQTDSYGNQYIPSIWTMEEKGMAFGLNKPFLLLIQNGIHEDFWKKTAPTERHIFFSDWDDFHSKLDEITNKVVNRLFLLKTQDQA